jgi:hypothetical protein
MGQTAYSASRFASCVAVRMHKNNEMLCLLPELAETCGRLTEET